MMPADAGSLLTLLQKHLSWYPLMELRDVYKLLYQGVMGAEHLLPSRVEYTSHLLAEFELLQPDPTGRLLEPIRPNGALYRLNLRPLKSRQQALDQLISYLLETARIITGTRSELDEVWTAFTLLCQDGRIQQFDRLAIEQFSQWLVKMEYPALHHSATYNREYQPAYRLIAIKFIHELGIEES